MLLARFLSKIMPISAPLRPAYGFTIATPIPSHPLQAKIYATNTFDDFCKLYQQNKQDINGEMLAISSKHIISLVSTRDYRLSFDGANILLNGLSAIDLSSLSQKTTSSLLSILRSLRIKGFVSSQLIGIKGRLVAHYANLIRDKRAEELEIVELIGAYNQLAFFKVGQEGRLLAKKILTILKEGVAQGRVAFGNSQVFFLLHCLGKRGELSPVEVEIRGLMLRQVAEGLSSIKLRDLVRVAVSLNRMEFLDLNLQQTSQLRLISQSILQRVQELQLDSIMEFIRGEFVSKYGGFFRIYEEINKNLFASISKKGKSEIDADSIFVMLTNIGSKIPLDRNTEQNQDKFFAFLDKFVHQSGNDANMARGLAFKLNGLIINGFFNQKHRDSIIDMFSATGFPLSTNIVYELAVRGSDITPLANFLGSFDPENLKEEILLKLGVIMHHLTEKGFKAEKFQTAIEQRMEKIIATPQLFMDFLRRLSRYSVKIQNFHRAFSKVFDKLPNPFAANDQQFPPSYRGFYFTYLLQSLRYRDFMAFVQTHDAAITIEDFASLVFHTVQTDQGSLFEVSRGLLQLVVRRMHSVVESKHKRSLDAIIEMLSKYCRFVVYGSIDTYLESTIFKILHYLISHYELVVELKAQSSFLGMIDRYLTRNYRRYNIETQYRSLLKYLLGKLEQIVAERPRLGAILVSNALRLNCLKGQVLTKINLDDLKGLYFVDRSKISYLKDRSFKPELDRISASTLHLIFSNPNLESVLVENEKKLIEIIQNAKPKDLVSYLSQYSGFKSPAYYRIVFETLKKLLAQDQNFDKLDMTTLLANALENNFFYNRQFRKLTERLIDEYRRRINIYSVDSHLELVKFIISQPTMNPLQYYNQLTSYAKQGDDQHYEAVLLRLATTNYHFKDEELQWLDNITRRNLFSGIYFFLMQEQRFDAATRSKFVKDFSQKFSSWLGKNKATFNSIHYQYLKKVYPEETASLNLPSSKIHYEKLSGKSKNPKYINTIIHLAGGVFEELKEFGPENYLLKVKNCVIGFLLAKKIGSYHEHEFTKRAISTIRGEELHTIFIHPDSYEISSLEYIRKAVPTLFDQVEYQKVITQYMEKQQKAKEARQEKERQA